MEKMILYLYFFLEKNEENVAENLFDPKDHTKVSKYTNFVTLARYQAQRIYFYSLSHYNNTDFVVKLKIHVKERLYIIVLYYLYFNQIKK